MPCPYKRCVSRKLKTFFMLHQMNLGQDFQVSQTLAAVVQHPAGQFAEGWLRTCWSNSNDFKRSFPARKCSIQTDVSTRIMRFCEAAVCVSPADVFRYPPKAAGALSGD